MCNDKDLARFHQVISEVSIAIANPSRVAASDNEMEALLAATASAGLGGVGSLTALYLSGSVIGFSAAGVTSGLASVGALVGGGMVAGVTLLALPVAGVGYAGYRLSKHLQRRKRAEKLLEEAENLLNPLVQSIQNTSNSPDRLNYLQHLLVLLNAVISDLRRCSQ